MPHEWAICAIHWCLSVAQRERRSFLRATKGRMDPKGRWSLDDGSSSSSRTRREERIHGSSAMGDRVNTFSLITLRSKSSYRTKNESRANKNLSNYHCPAFSPGLSRLKVMGEWTLELKLPFYSLQNQLMLNQRWIFPISNVIFPQFVFFFTLNLILPSIAIHLLNQHWFATRPSCDSEGEIVPL